jgi:NADPH:quinone reductase-like Zn-dependent oxidoreductase
MKMKAVSCTKYGAPDVLQLVELPVPTPQSGEVLVRIHATTVTAADLMMRTGLPVVGRLYLGLRRPSKPVFGFDFAGEVVALGPDVTAFKVGQRVFGGTTNLGCYAEYACIKADDVILEIPDGITYEQAAPVAGSAITVWNFLKGQANLQAGQKVLIYGASGGLGTYAVQIAKALGAEVTAVCSTNNVEWVKALGADHVVDYTQQSFVQQGAFYDIIFDTVSKCTFGECKSALTKKGIYLAAVLTFPLLLRMLFGGLLGSKKVKVSATGMLKANIRLDYLKEITKLMQAGKMHSVIDRQMPLAAVAEAHSYVAQGRKKGNLVVLVP